ncbi:MAG: helix-turn-helix domain-containing protein [Anaerolineales bacterium]|nr:helix-turn-helix domain-containing protein [Anaerolineales bacterium]
MNRQELGHLVAALRKEHFDEDGNRYTQAKLAEKAQRLDPLTPLNEIVIGKIERGERAILDEHTLLSLADALELTIGERRTFFMLATGLDYEQMYPATESAHLILDKTIQMLADIQLPALLLDCYLDVIAANSLLLQMYQTTALDLQSLAGQPASFNLLWLIFSDFFAPMRAQMSPQQWHNFAVGNVIYFRRTTLPYRMTDYFAELLARLRRERNFRWFWEQVFYEEQRYFVGGESFQMGSPDTGRYRFLTAPLVTLTSFGNLEIITHIPRDRETAVSFQKLAQQTPPTVLQLSTWPEKAISCH